MRDIRIGDKVEMTDRTVGVVFAIKANGNICIQDDALGHYEYRPGKVVRVGDAAGQW